MAHRFYVTIQGSTQGVIKGQGSGREKDKIPGVAFSYGVERPVDAASGVPSGKRQHKPVVITKEWGAASPELYQAIVTNEVLKSVLCEFVSVNALGVEEVTFTIELTNATIVGFDGSVQLGEKDGPVVDTRELERIEFEFQRITVTSVTGGTTAIDDWEVGA
jgi:type VI secretion system secreted protein Hcp